MYVSIIDLHRIISCLVWVVVAMPSECLYRRNHLVVYDLICMMLCLVKWILCCLQAEVNNTITVMVHVHYETCTVYIH